MEGYLERKLGGRLLSKWQKRFYRIHLYCHSDQHVHVKHTHTHWRMLTSSGGAGNQRLPAAVSPNQPWSKSQPPKSEVMRT